MSSRPANSTNSEARRDNKVREIPLPALPADKENRRDGGREEHRKQKDSAMSGKQTPADSELKVVKTVKPNPMKPVQKAVITVKEEAKDAVEDRANEAKKRPAEKTETSVPPQKRTKEEPGAIASPPAGSHPTDPRVMLKLKRSDGRYSTETKEKEESVVGSIESSSSSALLQKLLDDQKNRTQAFEEAIKMTQTEKDKSEAIEKQLRAEITNLHNDKVGLEAQLAKERKERQLENNQHSERINRKNEKINELKMAKQDLEGHLKTAKDEKLRLSNEHTLHMGQKDAEITALKRQLEEQRRAGQYEMRAAELVGKGMFDLLSQSKSTAILEGFRAAAEAAQVQVNGSSSASTQAHAASVGTVLKKK